MSSPTVPSSRAHEAQQLVDMARLSRVTLLVAEPGSDKSALLRSTVMPLLERDAAGAKAEIAILFDAWDEAPLSALQARVEQVAAALPAAPIADRSSLLASLRALQEALGVTFLIIFDRFEEYLRTPQERSGFAEFEASFVEIAKDRSLQVNFLLAFDAEAEPLLARLQRRIPQLRDARVRLPRAAQVPPTRPLAHDVASEPRRKAESSIVAAWEALHSLAAKTPSAGQPHAGPAAEVGVHALEEGASQPSAVDAPQSEPVPVTKTSSEPVNAVPPPIAETLPLPIAETLPPAIVETVPPPIAETAPPPIAETLPPPIAETLPPPIAETLPPPIAETALPPPIAETEPPSIAEPVPPPIAETAPPPIAEMAPPPIAEMEPPPIAEMEPPPIAEMEPPPIAEMEPPPIAETPPPPIEEAEPPPIAETVPPPIAETVPPPIAETPPPPLDEAPPPLAQAHASEVPKPIPQEPTPPAHAAPKRRLVPLAWAALVLIAGALLMLWGLGAGDRAEIWTSPPARETLTAAPQGEAPSKPEQNVVAASPPPAVEAPAPNPPAANPSAPPQPPADAVSAPSAVQPETAAQKVAPVPPPAPVEAVRTPQPARRSERVAERPGVAPAAVPSTPRSTVQRAGSPQAAAKAPPVAAAPPAPAEVPAGPALYINITSEAQRARAEQLVKPLNERGIRVAGIRVVPPTPDGTHITYTHNNDRNEAVKLSIALRDFGLGTQHLRQAEEPAIPARARQYELWLPATGESAR